ncbi:hypothetical protein, partial [Cryobacterium fucosi]|uniref:hypothetical protein n=1 Tax=Cryobacterium fucosi TaxID=1259157 RepID=UPI001A7E2137
ISAQSSNLITFHSGWWSYCQLAFLALFSVGVNNRERSHRGGAHARFRSASRDGLSVFLLGWLMLIMNSTTLTPREKNGRPI